MKTRKKILYIVLACVFALAALCIAAYFIMSSRDFQLFGSIVSRVDTDKKIVALTFDDGPSERTPQVLAALEKLDVKCTFFLNGKQMEENMDLARAIAQAGHQIGNHTYSHDRMIFKSAQAINFELDRTSELIREAGYDGEIVFRPPGCKKLIMLPLALDSRNMLTVTWDVEPETYVDETKGAQGLADYALDNARSGSVILLHVMYGRAETSLEAVPLIVEGLRAKGYEFVTVGELLASATG